jgi:hypothetical protein
MIKKYINCDEVNKYVLGVRGHTGKLIILEL